jgi:hypothetical protein
VAPKEVGGVMATRNWIGSTPEIALDLITKVPYCRTIGKILKPTLKGHFRKDREPLKAPPTLEDGARKEFLMESQGLVSPQTLANEWSRTQGGSSFSVFEVRMGAS